MARNGPANQRANNLFALTAGKKYNPDALYIVASDDKGHSESIRLKIPPTYEYIIQAIMREHEEFRTVQDFIRDAIVHSLHRWVDNPPFPDPAVAAWLRSIRMQATHEVVQAITKQHRESIATAQATMEMHAELEDWNAINEIVVVLDETAEDEEESLPPGLAHEYGLAADYGRELMTNGLLAKTRRNRGQ